MTRYIEPPANLPIVPMLANTDKSKPGTEDVHFRDPVPGDMVGLTPTEPAAKRRGSVPASRSLQPMHSDMTQRKERPIWAPNDLLSVDDVRDHLLLSRAAVYRLVARRQLPHYRLPSGLRFKAADLDVFLDGLRAEARRSKKYGAQTQG